MRSWLAVAALLIGLLNALAFQQLLAESSASTESAAYSLISDYNLYE
jgi:hypothetical protein